MKLSFSELTPTGRARVSVTLDATQTQLLTKRIRNALLPGWETNLFSSSVMALNHLCMYLSLFLYHWRFLCETLEQTDYAQFSA